MMTDMAGYLKKELYERVRQDDDIFEFVQTGSLDGIWYWDIEQPENEWMSREFKALFGYEDHEIPNTASWWQENLNPGQLEDVLARFTAHLSDPNVPYDQVVSYRHKDGSTVWVRCRGVAIRDPEGKPIRMLGCHTDITQLKRTELELNQRLEELEEANRELKHFASIISHDLQEPLRKINVFGSMLRDLIEDDIDEEALDYLTHIEHTSQRMSSMIRSMLEYTRLSYDKVPKESVDLNTTVDHVIFDLAAAINDSDAQVTHDTLPRVSANPMHMNQLFLNLISNALKFRKPDVSPRVHISHDSPDPHHIRLLIADNGIGLNAHVYGEKIFEPFQRLHRRAQFEGTGIGLAACRKIALLHHGTIDVESTPGQGTTFIVTLPTHELEEQG